MKYVSFLRPDGNAGYGRIDGDEIVELGGANPPLDSEGRGTSRSVAEAGGGATSPADLKAAIAAGSLAGLAGGARHPLAGTKLLPVIPNPGKILCVGHNYESHRQETGRAKVDHPSIFTRFADTLVGHDQPILRPKASTNLDYEAELAIVIGRGGRAIPEAEALDHVAGYACFNDASVRDWQWHTSQFTPGKNFPATGGFGPWLVTPDEAGDLSDVHVISRLNGEVMQDQPVRDMIFPIARIIAYVSAFTQLSPGDVIATGTPGGVGAKRTPPVWMKAGDMIEIDIGHIGTLINAISDEA